ncbi:MAG: DNA translocase FtsK 4TM domain-containing protein, partial [Deltaproteobacteria bacterium]|nr:DNA translocase FtsK 4TM domain-containing protein [Deltaproteobacteria bacterium]
MRSRRDHRIDDGDERTSASEVTSAKARGASATGKSKRGTGRGGRAKRGRSKASARPEPAFEVPSAERSSGEDPAAAEASAPDETAASGAEGRRRTARTYAREAAALVLLASALYAGLALASFRADPVRPEVLGDDWVGPVGALFAGFFVRMVGVVSWLIPLELALVARPLLFDRAAKLSIVRLSGNVLLAVTAASLVHIALPESRAFGAMPLGGAIGELFGEVLRGLFSTVGSFLVGLTIVALILLQRATFSFIDLVQRIQAWSGRLRSRCDRGVGAVVSAWGEARRVERARREQQRREAEPLIAVAQRADAIIAAFADDGDVALAGPSAALRTTSAPDQAPPSKEAAISAATAGQPDGSAQTIPDEREATAPRTELPADEPTRLGTEAETPSPTPQTSASPPGGTAGGDPLAVAEPESKGAPPPDES